MPHKPKQPKVELSLPSCPLIEVPSPLFEMSCPNFEMSLSYHLGFQVSHSFLLAEKFGLVTTWLHSKNISTNLLLTLSFCNLGFCRTKHERTWLYFANPFNAIPVKRFYRHSITNPTIKICFKIYEYLFFYDSYRHWQNLHNIVL